VVVGWGRNRGFLDSIRCEFLSLFFMCGGLGGLIYIYVCFVLADAEDDSILSLYLSRLWAPEYGSGLSAQVLSLPYQFAPSLIIFFFFSLLFSSFAFSLGSWFFFYSHEVRT